MTTIQNISISKPCNESWKNMTPDGAGRHCSICAKPVVDFSMMTTDDIMAHLSLNQKICGRFESHQIETLNAQLTKPAQFILSGWKKWSLAFGLLTSFSYFKANAQVKAATVQTSNKVHSPTTNIAIADSSLVTITGKIVDEQNYSIISANVVTRDGKHKAVTNMDGFFKMQVPTNTDYLMVNSIGFLQKVLLVDVHTSVQETAVLKPEALVMGEVMINPPKLTPYEKFIKWLRGDRIY